ncbi:MAG: GNVR domain-containing protein [Candidatus Babeliales bacterium]
MENQPQTKFQNPLAYLKLFFRRKWLIIGPLFAGAVLGIAAALVLPPVYESKAIILVEEQRTINPLIQDLAVSTSFAQRLQAIREEILSWNNLADLVKKLSLDKKVDSASGYEDLIAELRKKIVVQMNVQNLIQISYRNQNPQQTYLVVKTLTDTFIEENLKTVTRETDVAIDFLKEQLQVYKRKIKESEVSDLQDQLARLSIDSTEEHPLVKELKAKLDAAKKEMDSGEYKVADQEKPVTAQMRQALKQELDRLTGQEAVGAAVATVPGTINPDTLADPNTTLYKMFIMDKLDSAMARDIEVNRRIYDMLLQRLETAKITQRLEASKQGTKYNIVDPPRMPLKPVKPAAFMVLIGIFLGGAAGVGLIFMREFMDQSYLDIEDAKLGLTLPILGAISRITTHEEIAQERNKQTLWIFISATAGMFIVVMSMLYYYLKK